MRSTITVARWLLPEPGGPCRNVSSADEARLVRNAARTCEQAKRAARFSGRRRKRPKLCEYSIRHRDLTAAMTLLQRWKTHSSTNLYSMEMDRFVIADLGDLS